MPPFYMDDEHPRYDFRKFLDRLFAAYDWFGTWFVFAILVNYRMKQALRPVLPNFDYPTYSAKSSMSFTDMPLALYEPMAASREVPQK